jgi:Zn-dependent protease
MAYILAFFSLSSINPLQIIQFLVILFLSISFHEAAHAWMAYRCGDDTAKMLGRLTLNPIVHIDPIGTILMPLMMILFSFPLIGWGRPCPVNPSKFHNYIKGEVLVSLAGPASNIVLVVAGSLALRVLLVLAKTGMNVDILLSFFGSFVGLNIVLCIFNLVPIPPLDGSHVLRLMISANARRTYDMLFRGPIGIIALLLIVRSGLLSPIFNLGWNIVEWILNL